MNDTLGIEALFCPVGAFVLRGRRYDMEALYRSDGHYWYRNGINWTALVVWAGGVVVYLAIAGLPELGLVGLAPWLGATLPSFFFGFVVYAILGRVVTRGRVFGAAEAMTNDQKN